MIATLVIGGTMGYLQYREARSANKRAMAAAEARNRNLKVKYAQEGAGISTKHEREQKLLARESYLKQQEHLSTVASSAVATGSASTQRITGGIQDSYAIAGMDLAKSADQAQQMGHLNLTTGVDQTQAALASNWQNPVSQGFQGFFGTLMSHGDIKAGGEGLGIWDAKGKWTNPFA